MRIAGFIAIFVLIVGCGAESKFGGDKDDKGDDEAADAPSDEPGVPRSMLVQDAAALPPCTAEAEGWLVYVKADKKFKACSAEAWADVEVASPATRIVASIGCAGELEDSNGIWFNYSVAQMSTGDTFATGSIRDGLKQASATAFYSVQQVGALTAAILIQDDQAGAATAGYFTIELNRKTLVTTISYKDSEGDLSWSMKPSACVANAYDKE